MFKALFKLITAFVKKTQNDNLSAFAAESTLFVVISFFPFVMFLLTLLQYLPFSEDVLTEVVGRFVPTVISGYIFKLIDELYNSSTVTLLSVTIVATLWTASRGMMSVYRGLNSIYRTNETRNFFILRFKAMFYTIVFAVLLILLLGVFVFGNTIINWINVHFPLATALNRYAVLVMSLRNIVTMAVLFIVFMVMYKFMPNRKTKLLYEIPGALLSALFWVVYSYLYSFFINNLGNMSTTYGSLTAIVLAVFWLYACMSIVLVGAELNVLLANERVRYAFGYRRRRKRALSGTLSDVSDMIDEEDNDEN